MFGEWWRKLPRKIYATLEKIETCQPWYSVYKIQDWLYVLYEDGQYDEALMYLVIGEEKAVVIDGGTGIGRLDKLVEELEEKIHQIDAKRVVIDTLATLFHRFPDPVERKIAVVDLVESLSELGITAIITTELSRLGPDRSIMDEEYMVHGVLMMQTMFLQENMRRALHVEKMRGTKVIQKRVPYIIDKNGIEVFPDMRLFQE